MSRAEVMPLFLVLLICSSILILLEHVQTLQDQADTQRQDINRVAVLPHPSVETRKIHDYSDKSSSHPFKSIIPNNIPAQWPTDGTVTSLFGYRIHPISKTRRFHEGIDIANLKSTEIVATADGLVKFSGLRGGYGKTVILDHGNGFETSYSHANEILVSNGMKIKRGTVIARMGSTGYSTGEHLHYEVRYVGESLDPAIFVK